MASNNNGGERRKRIVERGSDRMALITGRINALPPSPSSATSSPTLPRHPQDGGAEDNKHDATNSSRLKHQGGFKNLNFETKNEVEPLLQDSSNTNSKNNKPKSTSSKSVETNQSKKPRNWRKRTFFSSRELNFSILASENTRALCSMVIAVLVVLSYKIFSRNVFASRPLYIVLVNDVTIVVARIYREKARVLKENQGEMVDAGEDGHSWGDAVKLLERGLVLYQALRGIFIDCSIYLVVVVCCISLMNF